MSPTITKEENKAPSILLVEDTPAEAMHFKIYLEEKGCNVNWVETGSAGLEAVYQNHYDLIVLDIELPDTDGFEVCSKLKADPRVADIPVIMLTTRDQGEDALVGLNKGAVDYIPKDPFAEMVLLATLKQMGLKVKE